METTYHAYYFDIREADQKAAYLELKKRLKAQGLECFETWGGDGSHYNPSLDGIALTLETGSLFANQWNTAPVDGLSENGYRVFDWAQDYPINISKTIKRGHYLDQTSEMAEIRRNTYKCGYCGKQEPAAKGYVFCPHCLDSEYLDEKTLHLTRMMPVAGDPKRSELSEAERAHLLPLFREAQLHGTSERGTARLAKQRQDIISKAEKTINYAKYERDGLLWLLDHGIKIDNVIFYDHRGMFSFGWRKPVSADMKSALLDVLSEFDFPYEIKSEAGDVSTVAA